MLFEFLFCFHQHTMFTAPTFQAPELARLVTSPSRHGSGSGGREPTARWPAPPPGRAHRLMMQRDLPLLQTRPAGLREAQGLTLGPTVVSRSRAAQSLARGLAQKPVGSALRCGRRFSGLLCPREEVCGQCPAHSTWVLALSADCESPCAGLPLTSSSYKCANQ